MWRRSTGDQRKLTRRPLSVGGEINKKEATRLPRPEPVRTRLCNGLMRYPLDRSIELTVGERGRRAGRRRQWTAGVEACTCTCMRVGEAEE